MSGTLLCITSMMPGRTCVIRDHHLTTCEGECKGCLPRPAETGHLCRGCWERFEAALAEAVELIVHLRSVEKGPTSIVPTRNAPGSRVLMPGSWMEADNLWGALVQIALVHARAKGVADPVWAPMYDGFSVTATLGDVALKVRELVGWLSANPVEVVSRAGGAEAGVEFYRKVQAALARFPLADRPQRLKPIRCRECQQFTLWKHPPLEYLDDVIVQCANASCGAIYDPSLASFDMLVLAEEATAEMSEDLRGQVRKLLDRVPAGLLAVRGMSESCSVGGHDRLCRSVNCVCGCHVQVLMEVGGVS